MDRWEKVSKDRRKELEAKYGKLPKKPPTLSERWEKEGKMYEASKEQSEDTQK